MSLVGSVSSPLCGFRNFFSQLFNLNSSYLTCSVISISGVEFSDSSYIRNIFKLFIQVFHFFVYLKIVGFPFL